MKVPRLAGTIAQPMAGANRVGQERFRWSLAIAALCAAAWPAVKASKPIPNDPFLPFMRTRVPPPGTNVPADPYYPGGATTTAPPATGLPPTPPPAVGPPSTMPAAPPAAPSDKYSPPGGYNLPQSSIDRSKVGAPAAGEVKAGGTAIARLSLAKTGGDASSDDGQLTATTATGTAMAAAAATAVARPTSGGTADDGATTLDRQRQRFAVRCRIGRRVPDLAFADAPAAETAKPAPRLATIAARCWPPRAAGPRAVAPDRHIGCRHQHVDSHRRSRSAQLPMQPTLAMADRGGDGRTTPTGRIAAPHRTSTSRHRRESDPPRRSGSGTGLADRNHRAGRQPATLAMAERIGRRAGQLE